MSEYPRGSEWRKWDLHIHSTASDGTATPAEIIEEAKSKGLSVIALTDHHSVSNIDEIKLLGNKEGITVISGIEFRTEYGAKSVHMIGLFPSQYNGIELNQQALSDLILAPLNLSTTQIVAEGRRLDPLLDEENAFKKGMFQVQADFKTAANLVHKYGGIISVHAGNKSNTIEEMKHDGKGTTNVDLLEDSLGAVKEDLLRNYVDICEVQKCSEATFYLKTFGRPSIAASDAHEKSKVGTKFVWIKADPTFNGLKQIIYEPEERVCISSSHPQEKPSYQVIESITINDDSFQTEPIFFNDKLTCIIGGKSTGKSILLHNLARAIAPDQVQEKCEISTGKGKNDKNKKSITLEIDPSKLNVKWANGQETNGQSIVYIPQTYLNRLADSAQEKTEIDEIIEKVLLDRIDSQGNKLIQKKVELLDKVDSIKSSNTNKLLDIIRLHTHIVSTKNEITELGGKDPIEQELKNLRQERDVLTKKLNIKEDDVRKYDEAVNGIAAQSKRLEQIDQEIQKIGSIEEVVQQSEEFSDCSEEISQKLQSIIAEIIATANETWTSKKEEIISWLNSQKDETAKVINALTLIRDSLKDTIESSIHIKELANKIAKEGEKLKEVENKAECVRTEQERMNALVDDVASSSITLRTVYNEYAKCIKENTVDDDSGLKYDVQIPFRQDDFLTKWSELYRATSTQNRSIIDVTTFCPEKYTKELLVQIIMKTLNGELSTLKAGENLELTLRNIIGDWYNIKYIVKMGNDSIDIMSPGKKALVLLQLLIDLADSECPILIDQPEDDLDNRSIFEQLIPFIKRKKITRQIIVVTHNANIVVGSDAEEVIVANQDGADCENRLKRFEYRSGSIENDCPALKPDKTIEDGILSKQGIQQHICDILEGGIKAFEKRKNKYRFIK